MRLRFTIRDLLWLAALVAVCVAWWLDRGFLSSAKDKSEQEANFYRAKSDDLGSWYAALVRELNELAKKQSNVELQTLLKQHERVD